MTYTYNWIEDLIDLGRKFAAEGCINDVTIELEPEDFDTLLRNFQSLRSFNGKTFQISTFSGITFNFRKKYEASLLP